MNVLSLIVLKGGIEKDYDKGRVSQIVTKKKIDEEKRKTRVRSSVLVVDDDLMNITVSINTVIGLHYQVIYAAA